MADAEIDGDDETVDCHVTITKSHAERLKEQYDAPRLTDALRMSSLEAVRERESQMCPSALHDSYLSALEEWTDDRDAVIIVNDGDVESLLDKNEEED